MKAADLKTRNKVNVRSIIKLAMVCLVANVGVLGTTRQALAQFVPAAPLTAGGQRERHAAVKLYDGRILVGGGYDNLRNQSASTWLYDSIKKDWTQTGSMPAGGIDLSFTLLANGQVLAVGGYAAASTVDLYTPRAGSGGTWSAAAPMLSEAGHGSQNRAGHGAVLLSSALGAGRVLIVGGADGAGNYHTAQLFTPDASVGSWSLATTPIFAGRNMTTATELADGNVLVVGGRNDADLPLKSAELYVPNASGGNWIPEPDPAIARMAHTATRLNNGNVLVVGGSTSGAAELYHPAVGSTPSRWTSAGSLAVPRSNHVATLLPCGTVVITGGIDSAGQVVGVAEAYDPDTNTWSEASPATYNSPRLFHTSTLTDDGQVLLFGGDAGPQYNLNDVLNAVNTAEVYAPIACNTLTNIDVVNKSVDCLGNPIAAPGISVALNPGGVTSTKTANGLRLQFATLFANPVYESSAKNLPLGSLPLPGDAKARWFSSLGAPFGVVQFDESTHIGWTTTRPLPADRCTLADQYAVTPPPRCSYGNIDTIYWTSASGGGISCTGSQSIAKVGGAEYGNPTLPCNKGIDTNCTAACTAFCTLNSDVAPGVACPIPCTSADRGCRPGVLQRSGKTSSNPVDPGCTGIAPYNGKSTTPAAAPAVPPPATDTVIPAGGFALATVPTAVNPGESVVIRYEVLGSDGSLIARVFAEDVPLASNVPMNATYTIVPPAGASVRIHNPVFLSVDAPIALQDLGVTNPVLFPSSVGGPDPMVALPLVPQVGGTGGTGTGGTAGAGGAGGSGGGGGGAGGTAGGGTGGASGGTIGTGGAGTGGTIGTGGAGTGGATSGGLSIGLRGTDALEGVVKDILGQCPGTVGGVGAYLGGGSSAGEAAMISGAAPTQLIAPMSRQLSPAAFGLCNLGVDVNCTTPCVVGTDSGCTGSPPANGKRVACDPSHGAQELLVALDGVVVVAANQPHRDSLNGGCTDAVVGDKTLTVPSVNVTVNGATVAKTCGATEGCGIPGTYVFKDWRDVLALLYAGQNHTAAAATVLESPVPADPRYNPATAAHKIRNPARVDCSSAARVALANNWGTMFSDNGGPNSCRTSSCIKLKHAFRRGDLSGTTDTFVSLVGLAIPVPSFTSTVNGQFPAIDSTATANPFCNSGEAPMNKGDSDYLDLDPIRRIADSDGAATFRLGLEQVAEGYTPPSNPPAVRGVDNRVEPAVTVLADSAQSNYQNMGIDSAVAGGIPAWVTKQAANLSPRKGLGLVLPIEIPTNFVTEDKAYWSPTAAPGAPVKCAPGVFAPTLLGANVMCPDGSGPNLCLLPIDATGTNFNCLSDSPVPASSPIKDSRVYNLLVVTPGGKFLKDNYSNPNLTLSVTARQNRVVSAYFRLHTSRATDLGGTPTVIGNPGVKICKEFASTDQIGCLVRANPCSIGFAGREAVDAGNLSLAFQIGKVGSVDPTLAWTASPGNIANITLNPTAAYPLARTLWVNSYVGISAVLASGDTTGQKDLLNCMGASGSTTMIDGVVAARRLIPMPPGTVRTRTCPATFP